MDTTDDPAHGQQQLGFYHGYYETYCYLPLLVYTQVDDGPQQLAAAALCPGNVHASHQAVSILIRFELNGDTIHFDPTSDLTWFAVVELAGSGDRQHDLRFKLAEEHLFSLEFEWRDLSAMPR